MFDLRKLPNPEKPGAIYNLKGSHASGFEVGPKGVDLPNPVDLGLGASSHKALDSTGKSTYGISPHPTESQAGASQSASDSHRDLSIAEGKRPEKRRRDSTPTPPAHQEASNSWTLPNVHDVPKVTEVPQEESKPPGKRRKLDLGPDHPSHYVSTPSSLFWTNSEGATSNPQVGASGSNPTSSNHPQDSNVPQDPNTVYKFNTPNDTKSKKDYDMKKTKRPGMGRLKF
jgi:hypothetical protein